MAKKSSKKKAAKRKPSKKRSARKTPRKGKKKTARKVARRPKKKPGKAARKGPKLPAEPIGRVTHYFPKVRATAVMIEKDGLRVGDTLYFKGHTTAFKQTVNSLQINHQSVEQASSGEEVGIQVKFRTREHDLVFKL